MSFGRGERLLFAGTVVAVAVGVVARFVTTSPMWLDEALSVNISSLPLADIGDALRRDGHPPLYYWLLHGWMELFGDGDVAVRALSGILSVLTLPLAWIAGHRRAGPSLGALALIVFALTPFCIRYATEARMYSLVMLLVLAGYLVLSDLLVAPTWWRAVAIAIITGSLLWTHYWSLYLLAVVGALLLVRWWRDPERRDGTLWALGALVAGGLSFLPWISSLIEQADRTGTPWALPARPTQVVSVTLQDLGGIGEVEAYLFGFVCLLLVLLGLLGRLSADTRTVVMDPRTTPVVRREVLVAAATVAVGATVGFLLRSAYESRYAATVVPLLLLAVAAGFLATPRRWPLLALAGIWTGLALVGIGRNVVEPRSQAEELADRIDAAAGPGDVVVTCPDQLGPSIERALGQVGADVDVLAYPTLGDGRFVDWRDYEARNDAADPVAVAGEVLERAGDGDVWVVVNGTYRTFEGDCEALSSALGSARTGESIEPVGDYFESAALQRFRAP